MGYPSYLESISERLAQSLAERTNNQPEGNSAASLSLEDIKKAFKEVMDQAFPPKFRQHLYSPNADKEFYYKEKYDDTKEDYREIEVKFDQKVLECSELTTQLKEQYIQIMKIKTQLKESKEKELSYFNDNLQLQAKCSILTQKLLSSEANFESKLKVKEVIFEQDIKETKATHKKELERSENQRLRDISDWQSTTTNIKRH